MQESNKNIVVLHPAYWEQAIGGAEIQIKYLITFLIKRGVTVHYIFEDKGSSYHNPMNLRLYPLKKVNLSKRLGNRWFFYRKRINHLLNEIEPDAIYTRFYSSWSGFSSEYSIKKGVPHIWAIAHDTDITRQFEKIAISKPFDKIEKKYVEKAFLKAKHILTQNQYQQNSLKKYYGRTGELLTQASPVCDEKKIIKNYDKISIIWIANLKAIKQPEIYLKIVEEFEADNMFDFKMVGRPDEKYLQEIRRIEAKNPQFAYLGELSNKKVNELLLNTNVLINTSKSEGFSNTFVQAWMRKNIVISMNSNPDDILIKRNVGFLISDYQKIVETLKQLASDVKYLKTMEDEAFKYARQFHNLNDNLERIHKLLNI